MVSVAPSYRQKPALVRVVQKEWGPCRATCTICLLIKRKAAHLACLCVIAWYFQRPTNPRLVLVVGPPKTGSTFLQCTLSQMKAANILKRDNYVFLGTDGHCKSDNPNILKHTHEENHSFSIFQGGVDEYNFRPGPLHLTDSFKRMFQQAYEQRQNVIFVYELAESYFFDRQIEPLRSFLSDKFDVRLVVTYRYYFDWYGSLYNEMWKPMEFNLFPDVWPGEVTLGSFHDSPLNMTGRHILPFDTEDRGNISMYFRYHQKDDAHPAQTVLTRFMKFFAHSHYVVDMTNMSSSSSPSSALLQDFLCNAVPNAQVSCSYSRLGKFPMSNESRASFPINYDLLALAANDRGMVNATKFSRKEVRKKIQTFHETRVDGMRRRQGYTDFPLTCLDEKRLDDLMSYSFRFDKNFFGANSSRHQHQFEVLRATKKAKFCSVRTDIVLQDAMWQNFFKTLE